MSDFQLNHKTMSQSKDIEEQDMSKLSIEQF